MRRTAADARSFDHMPEHFDRFAELVGGRLDEFIESQLPQGGGERAIDLGCGTGRHAAILARHYRRVIAVDISPQMLQAAQTKRALPNVVYQQRDLCEVAARPSSGIFDFVLSAYALHHVDDHELDQTLRSIRELVAPGGRVVLIDNVAPTRQVSRRWFIGEARRTLAGDLWHHRRPIREALELYRLNVDPAWLAHLTSDRFLTPEQFADRYSTVFPGATFTDLYRARALCWTCPTSAPLQPNGEQSVSTHPASPPAATRRADRA